MLPRLIIADEIQEDKIPPSIFLIQAMRSRQIPLRVFFCARRDEDLRLMNLLGDSPVCCLDAYTAMSARNLKTLFQQRASEDALNIISVPLGTAIDEKTFQVFPEGPELAKILDCGVIPVVMASPVAVLSANIAIAAAGAFNDAIPDKVEGIIFSSVRNSREFQLLEKEYNRRTPILSLGFMPRETDVRMPAMPSLSGKNTALELIPIKSAALQFGGSTARQVDWGILEAMGNLHAQWPAPEPMTYQKRNLTVAVIGANVSLEGDGNLEAFRMLGCTLQHYMPGDFFPTDADVLYFPHTLNEPYIGQLLADANFRQGVIACFRANRLILATGASALLFGESYRTLDKQQIEGLRIFPFSGHTSHNVDRRHMLKRIEIRGIQDTNFIKNNEKLRGYSIEGFSIANPGNLTPPCFSYREMKGSAELGLSGWTTSYCFVTDLRLDLWGAMDILNRWLNLRRKA